MRKMINLSKEAEPEIYATTSQWGTVLENVVMDPVTRELDFADNTLAEKYRGAYPISAIENASLTGRCGQPKNLIMLTCDAFGIMPPIAKLTPAQAMYHFLSGTQRSRWHGKGSNRADSDVLNLLRWPVHAASSKRLRKSAARSHQQI